MPEFQVRLAIPQDIPAMASLLSQLFAIETDFHIDAASQERGLGLLLDKCQSHSPGHAAACCLVAETEQQVIGMCSVQVVISTAMGCTAGQLEDLIVDRPYRSSGVGSALLRAAESWCQAAGITRIQLLADAENHYAHDFYQRHHWQKTRLVALHRFMSQK